jgi:hypothetical protein
MLEDLLNTALDQSSDIIKALTISNNDKMGFDRQSLEKNYFYYGGITPWNLFAVKVNLTVIFL